MTRCLTLAVLCALVSCAEAPPRESTWQHVTEEVWRSPGSPAAYALVDGDAAILFGAAAGADTSELPYAGIAAIEGVYLTHHHRDSAARAGAWTALGLPVRAPRASAPWLTPEDVQKFWRDFVPSATPPGLAGLHAKTFATWDYLVLPEGLAAVECSIDDGAAFDWRGWTITPVATPGHSRGHVAYAARRKNAPATKPLVFCGDALAAPGKLWTPYTAEWDPSGDNGLRASAASLRALAALEPEALFPEHGAPILEATVAALSKSGAAAEEAAFLKSYERYSKDRKANPPPVKYLDRYQVGTDGRKPWTRLSEHLHFTGTTYALSSRRGGLCLIDPFGELIAAQVVRAQLQRLARDVEIAIVTHAHGDHYSGVHDLASRGGLDVWALDQVATVIAEPAYQRTPHAHPRPIAVERAFRDGQRVDWHEYTFTFRRLPGHTRSGSAVLTEIDGHRVAFVGDTFLHADQDGGSGGWSGFNGGFPSDYADSAGVLLAERPEWILCSRGGAFDFVAPDWERRIAWGAAAAQACDRLSVSGRHRFDWDPGLVRVEPFVSRAVAGATTQVELVVNNPLDLPQTLAVEIAGRGLFDDVRRSVQVPPAGSMRLLLTLKILDAAIPGPHVVPLRILAGDVERGDDAYFVLEVARP
jgi:glyoxylase-like metal-dependent hydrolase (beta-lactamase superfamily II)